MINRLTAVVLPLLLSGALAASHGTARAQSWSAPGQIGAANEVMPALPQKALAGDALAALLDGLRFDGWDAQPSLTLTLSGSSYLDGQGQTYDVIAGQQAALLKEYGCVQVVTRTFKRTQRQAAVVVFCFDSPLDACGAYSLLREGSSTVLVRGEGSSEDDDSISFWQGTNFVRLASSADADEMSKELIRTIADKIGPQLGPTSTGIVPMAKLPAGDRVPGTQRLFKGPLSGKRLLSVPFSSSLRLDRIKVGVCSDYFYEPPDADRMRLILLDYGDPVTAREIFSSYRDQLAAEFKSDPQAVDADIYRLQTSFLRLSLSGNVIAIISGARHKRSPAMLALVLGQ